MYKPLFFDRGFLFSKNETKATHLISCTDPYDFSYALAGKFIEHTAK